MPYVGKSRGHLCPNVCIIQVLRTVCFGFVLCLLWQPNQRFNFPFQRLRTDSIFSRNSTTESAVAGKDWPITTAAAESRSNPFKITTSCTSTTSKMPGIHLPTTSLVRGSRESLSVCLTGVFLLSKQSVKNALHFFFWVVGSPPDSGAHSSSSVTVAVSPPRMTLDCFRQRPYQTTASSASSSSLFFPSG